MKRYPQRVRSLAVIISLAILAAACGDSGGSDSTSDASSDVTSADSSADSGATGDASSEGRELRLAIGGEPDNGYDPTLGWGRYGSPLFHSTLLRLDENLEIVNDLATGYEVSEDGLTWTVTIRDDAAFTDGEPVTASDVAYTYMTAHDQPGLTDVRSLVDARATDDTTIEFELEAPQSTFVYRLATLGIVPEAAHNADYAQQPIGSGPYKFVQWDKGQQLIVERNDDYYGTMPAFERLVFLFTDEDGTLAAAKAGEVDVAAVPASLATGDIEGMNQNLVKSIDNRGISFPYLPDTGQTNDLGAPIGNNVTSDLAIRRAINIGIDRQALVDGVLQGYGSPATGPVDGAPWYNPDSAIADNDPEEAMRILEEAGWVDTDGDGIREKDGVDASFPLFYVAGDTVRQGLVLAVVDQIAAIGIEVTPESGSWEEATMRQHADAVLFGWGSHDPTEMYNLYSETFAGIEYWNPTYYSNPTVQGYLNAAMENRDPVAANDDWKNAQLDADGNGFTASADAAWAWLVNLEHIYYTNACLDIGATQTEPHGHGWPLTSGILHWKWTC